MKIISAREEQVLQLIALENTTDEIAGKLYISPATVNSHRKNLFSKLQARNSAGLIRIAYEKGILQLRCNYQELQISTS